MEAPWERRSSELVDHELRRLDVHVAVDEPGQQDEAPRVCRLEPVVAARHAGHVLTPDRDVGLEQLTVKTESTRPPFQHEVRGFVSSAHRQTVREIGGRILGHDA